MKNLNFCKNGMYLKFSITEENRLIILGINDTDKFNEIEGNKYYTPVELHTTGSNPDDLHGSKHTGSDDLFYDGYTESDNELIIKLKNDRVSVKMIYEFFEGIKTVRTHSEIQNISSENIGVEYVSSFCLYDIKPEKVYIPHSGWCREMNWKVYTPDELGYTKTNGFSTKRIVVSNTGTWSTKEYFPMGMIKEKDKMLFWQIEHNGSWNWEISDIPCEMYLKLSGPSEQENGWWKELKPNDIFVSVNTAISIVSGDFSDVVAEMTKYRRKIAYRSPKDLYLPVIFNDYLHCLMADPTAEKLLPVIDAAAEVGAEIFCMDAGWYADGTWWETVGEWQVCEKRFPNGMKEIFDYIHSKGMVSGIWIEPEVIGIGCPILAQFDNDCFFMRHGKRVIDHGRYLFDFRNKKVTDFLDGVVDRLVSEYGIGYFKFDYNIEGGVGTEVNSDSFGDGLMQHNEAFLKWIDGIYERYPDMIIESCASGGMRMDYKTLSHFSLQSLTDATSYDKLTSIAAMSQTAVIPEQAAVWSIPRKGDTLGEVAVNMVNAMFRRIHLSGETPWLDKQQFAVVKEGVELYKSTRGVINNITSFYPIGLCDFNSNSFVYGFNDDIKKYLCVINLKEDKPIYIPLNCEVKNVTKIYPKDIYADVNIKNNEIIITLPEKSAVILEIQ